jgi:hypothetical protein
VDQPPGLGALQQPGGDQRALERAHVAIPARGLGQLLGLEVGELAVGGVVMGPGPQHDEVPKRGNVRDAERARDAADLPVLAHGGIDANP